MNIESSENSILGNNINNNEIGMCFYISDDNLINDNSLVNNVEGIKIIRGKNNILEDNFFYSCDIGLNCSMTQNIEVFGSTIENNIRGVLFDSVFNSNVTFNSFYNNSFGFLLFFSSENVIKSNNVFFDRVISFSDSIDYNIWYNNYWGREHVFPKPIIGWFSIRSFFIPWISFDWNPAANPLKMFFNNND
jgi:parallel beta-helix repeat protein